AANSGSAPSPTTRTTSSRRSAGSSLRVSAAGRSASSTRAAASFAPRPSRARRTTPASSRRAADHRRDGEGEELLGLPGAVGRDDPELVVVPVHDVVVVEPLGLVVDRLVP